MRSLKIPKGNQRMTDKRKTKRIRTKGQTMIYKTLHRKLKTKQHDPHYKLGENPGVPEGSSPFYK
jgi:hypothetical protein